MKKFSTLLAALLFGLLALAAPASATGGNVIPSPDNNKKVTFCHATGAGKYESITTSINAFYNAGHINSTGNHPTEGDIYPAITWTNNKGEVVTVPAKGDQSLLAFEDCERPREDTPVTKPVPVAVDKCETAQDTFSVAPGDGYTVGAVQIVGLVRTIVVTLNDGFKWADGTTTPLTFTYTFTDVDCDLPETGVGATFNTTGGYLALGALAMGGVFLVTGGRRKAKATI